jgi:hypothetical protein
METQEASTPRGIRNNNPGNIRLGIAWDGLATTQTDPDFCQFTTAQFGIRAIEKILLTYHSEGLNTITAIISKWAPPVENNTQAYIDAVCASSGFTATQTIDVTEMIQATAIVEAIITHENGEQPYSQEIIQEGIALAGVQPITGGVVS